MPDWKPHYSGMRGELRESWANANVPVGLYVAYYRNQGPGEELVGAPGQALPDFAALAAEAGHAENLTPESTMEGRP